MTAPHFGLQFIRINDQPQPILGANLSVIGIVGPSEGDTNPETFPYDTPVLVYSNDRSKLADLSTDGYLLDAIDGINDQLAEFETAAQLVIVRTRYGEAVDANLKLQQTIANIMGVSYAGTGVHALLKAPNTLYCTPRVIICPGYTGQMANSLDSLVVDDIGVGYIPGQTYQVSFAPGPLETNGANLVMPIAHVVADAEGSINNNDIHIDKWGAWFTDDPVATLPAADGAPIIGLSASGQIIFSMQPGIGSTITLNATNVTFVSGTPGPLQVQIGANLAVTMANLLAMLEASSDPQISLCDYSVIGGTLLITYTAVGVIGNTFDLGITVTGASISGVTLTGGRNAAAQVNCTLIAEMGLGANPICAELTGVLNQLIGHAIVESAGTSEVMDKNWRTTMNSLRLIPISGGIKVIDPLSGEVVVKPVAPRVAGVLIARDHVTGYPFHSAANQPIQGVVGPSRTIEFNLTDGDVEGQSLLAANIGIVARGLVGVETAISSGGFVLIATDNAGDDELWRMYNVMRGRDFIHLSLMPALRVYLGRENIDRQTIVNILTTIKDFLNMLTARQQILGGRVDFKGSLNSASEIRLGHLTVGFSAEEAPVLKRITTMSARYRPAIDAMVQQLEKQLNQSAG